MTAQQKHDAEIAAIAVAEAKAKENEIAAKRAALVIKQVTQWLKPGCACGETAYKCKTTDGWCRCEVARLESKGVRACMVKHEDHLAVFRLDKRETREDIVAAIAEVGMHVRGCEGCADGEEEVQNG